MDIDFIQIPKDNSFESFREELSLIGLHTTKFRSQDNEWKNIVLMYLQNFYENLSDSEKERLSKLKEDEIKDYIRFRLNKSSDFNTKHLLIVNLEPQNESAQLGYYDLKFQSSLWDSYFVFECKCLNKSKQSIVEYVYNARKKRNDSGMFVEDGGLYRFVTNKYASNLPFGGMIGFIQQGNVWTIKDQLIEAISKFILKSGKVDFGHLIKTVNSSEDTSFQTIHTRFDTHIQQECNPIMIHHLLFDFSTSKPSSS